ncbi:MAG: tRNA (N(6)-L-threonylcarbamoyladenosine(37)-C(2))-methylthiotransferase MtaB [Chloroflexi bacterium]|nr:tRNA (N(6)-L-threonylcarbamoyladenosine(37)-C(2))-methylthiotransferase MtaB [Chloroflexota bacterium]
MPTVEIETHGCKLNTADSQLLAAEFLRAGFAVRDRDDAATPDVFILNSCTVTHVADKKARQSISAAKRRYPNALTVMTGCYPERATDETASLHSVDLVLGNSRKPELVESVARRLSVELTPCADGRDVIPPAALLGRTRASVKIQEGCDQVCAYCIVPRVRGRERSVLVEEIVDHVRRLEIAGCREVIFTGTQLGHYGFDLEAGVDLTFLLRSVLAKTEIPRIRVSSLQPPEIDDRLLDLWVAEGDGRLCPHFHMPLQSGSDVILGRMRRTYTSDEYLQKVELLRARVGGCGITTDVIAGFPGETEVDHEMSVSVMRAAEFADVHVFPYSARPGTTANHFDDQLDPRIKAERAAVLRDIASRSASRFRDAMIGTVRPVLWEGSRGSAGLTDNYVKVRLESVDERGGDGLIENVALRRVDSDGVVVGQAT